MVQKIRANAHERQQNLRNTLPQIYETDLDSIEVADDDEKVLLPQIYPSGLRMTNRYYGWILRKTSRSQKYL